MRRALWLLPILFIAIFVLRRADRQTDQTPLALRVAERYGKTNLTYTDGGHRRLELTLTGKRWHGLNDVVPDSARAIARYALEDLMGFERPDTIVVTIHATYKWGGMVTGSSGIHLATADL
jgi:hypothetical protein